MLIRVASDEFQPARMIALLDELRYNHSKPGTQNTKYVSQGYFSMLALHDERWKELTTFFEEPTDIPLIIKDWLQSIGSDQEYAAYCRKVFNVFLHQATIVNVAFAIVPWLWYVCKQGVTQWEIEYLADIALVEANRLRNGVYFNREGTEPYPEWVMADYHNAIIETRDRVDEVIEAEHDEERKQELVAMKPALYGNADLAWSQW